MNETAQDQKDRQVKRLVGIADACASFSAIAKELGHSIQLGETGTKGAQCLEGFTPLLIQLMEFVTANQETLGIDMPPLYKNIVDKIIGHGYDFYAD